MTLKDWHQAQEADPVLSQVIARLRDGTLGKSQSKTTDPTKVSQYQWEHNNLLLKKGGPIQTRESGETLLQLVLPATQREVALRGCHDEVGHLGLECMLDLMCDRFFWPRMAAKANKHLRKCHSVLAIKVR